MRTSWYRRRYATALFNGLRRILYEEPLVVMRQRSGCARLEVAELKLLAGGGGGGTLAGTCALIGCGSGAGGAVARLAGAAVAQAWHQLRLTAATRRTAGRGARAPRGGGARGAGALA